MTPSWDALPADRSATSLGRPHSAFGQESDTDSNLMERSALPPPLSGAGGSSVGLVAPGSLRQSSSPHPSTGSKSSLIGFSGQTRSVLSLEQQNRLAAMVAQPKSRSKSPQMLGQLRLAQLIARDSSPSLVPTVQQNADSSTNLARWGVSRENQNVSSANTSGSGATIKLRAVTPV